MEEVEVVVEESSFASLGLNPDLVAHLSSIGFKQPTEIQKFSIPQLIEQNRDFIGMASTGTGKTGAFAIPLIEKIDMDFKKPQALVLCPTRELAQQVAGQIQLMGQQQRLKVALIYGGSSYQTQIRALKQGAQVVVATPGRLIDLMEQQVLNLNDIKYLVLDEADEMLSLGFKEALNTILNLMSEKSHEHNTWLFSATMSSEIQRISEKYLKNPITVKKTSGKQVTEDIEQSYILVNERDKLEVLKRILMKHNDFYGLIFCQMREEAAELSNYLNKAAIPSEAMHGDKTQKDRERILEQFRKRKLQVVTATDVAARGIDVKDLTHVINWSLPWDVESYIHRIGRTGRNGQKGIAISLVSPAQIGLLRRIEKVTRKEIKKALPPSIDEVQEEVLQTIYNQMEKLLASERLGPRVQVLAGKIKVPDAIAQLDRETLLVLFAGLHEPDFLRQQSLAEPVMKSRSERGERSGPPRRFRRDGGGRGGRSEGREERSGGFGGRREERGSGSSRARFAKEGEDGGREFKSRERSFQDAGGDGPAFGVRRSREDREAGGRGENSGGSYRGSKAGRTRSASEDEGRGQRKGFGSRGPRSRDENDDEGGRGRPRFRR